MIGVVGEGLDPPVGKADLDGRIFRIFLRIPFCFYNLCCPT